MDVVIKMNEINDIIAKEGLTIADTYINILCTKEIDGFNRKTGEPKKIKEYEEFRIYQDNKLRVFPWTSQDIYKGGL